MAGICPDALCVPLMKDHAVFLCLELHYSIDQGAAIAKCLLLNRIVITTRLETCKTTHALCLGVSLLDTSLRDNVFQHSSWSACHHLIDEVTAVMLRLTLVDRPLA